MHKYRKQGSFGLLLNFGIYIFKVGCQLLGNNITNHGLRGYCSLNKQKSCSWNDIVEGYLKANSLSRALAIFDQIPKDSIFNLPSFTFVSLLKACGKLQDVESGQKIHEKAAQAGLLEHDVFIGSALVDMYVKCGYLSKAQTAFDGLPARNVVSWTALVAGYVDSGYGRDALFLFYRMIKHNLLPDAVTYVCGLKACAIEQATENGKEMYADIIKKGFETHIAVGGTSVDMYAKCGLLADAQAVFDKLNVQDHVSWTALIGGYAEHRNSSEAFNCFKQMWKAGFLPDAGTFVCCLKACVDIKDIDKVLEIHLESSKAGLDKNLILGGALVDVYAKCGLVAETQRVFKLLPVRNVVLWTALMMGYVDQGHCEDALNCLQQMQNEGFLPVSVTFVAVIKACGSIGATVRGREMHTMIVKLGFETDIPVGNTLVDMYAKCGLLREAQKVFDELSVRTVVSWTALITGYAQVGESDAVFHILCEMLEGGVNPNFITFVNTLNVCSHTGLLEKGQQYFELICHDFIPSHEHYSCLVDLLGRAGHIEKAIQMIEKMPFYPSIRHWTSVLGACKKWGNVDLGKYAFENIVCLDEEAASAYVCMSNIYGYAAMQDDAEGVHAILLDEDLCHNWWFDSDVRLHSCVVGS